VARSTRQPFVGRSFRFGLLVLVAGAAWHGPALLAERPTEAPAVVASPMPSAPPDLAAPVWHVVLFQLRPDAPSDAAARLIADSKRLLAQIPGVREVHAGRKAADARDVHVKDYDVAISVRLEGRATLAVYAADARHLELIARYREQLVGWRVIDFFAE
jgi:hypothetical protein